MNLKLNTLTKPYNAETQKDFFYKYTTTMTPAL